MSLVGLTKLIMEIPINNNYQWHKFFPNSGFFLILLDLVNFVNIFDVVFVGYIHARTGPTLKRVKSSLEVPANKKKTLIKQDPQIIKEMKLH